MQQYLGLLKHILEQGKPKNDRTGTGTRSVFGAQTRYNLRDRFPLLTTKRINCDLIVKEVLLFLNGATNIKEFHEYGVHLWDNWAGPDGSLGRIYGAQWTDWRTPEGRSINQLEQVVNNIRTNPDSRRHIVTAWNPGEIDQMAIPNCCSLFQFYVQDGELSCQLYQRSADIFLGVPFNIVQYSLITMMVAQVTGLVPGEFVHTFGDLHLYNNHVEQAKLQLSREPRPLPTMTLNPERNELKDFVLEDFKLEGYNPHPAIKAPVAI